MTDQILRTGGCLCGAVRFEASLRSLGLHACHCDICRRWGGGPSLSVGMPDGALRLSGAAPAVIRSSERAERGFCGTCGSHIFFRVSATGAWDVPLGAFDDQSGFHLVDEIFFDRKPAAYAFAGERPRRSGAETAATFTGAGDGPDPRGETP